MPAAAAAFSNVRRVCVYAWMDMATSQSLAQCSNRHGCSQARGQTTNFPRADRVVSSQVRHYSLARPIGGRRTPRKERAKPAPATEQAATAIMAMITSGELGPGDRLHTERDLAVRLGISRSTVREAIRGLNMLRVLDVRHGDGIFITSLDARSLLEVTGFAMQLLRDREVLHIFAVRPHVECAAAAVASARITAEQRAELGDRLQELDMAGGIEDLLEADIAFHASVAEAAGNPMLASLLDTFSARTYRARYL